MTRINSNIDPRRLTDEHLMAEHREIKRLPHCLKTRLSAKRHNAIPVRFTLGTGHVTFFLDKMVFTKDRYLRLHNECRRRGFDVQDYSENWNRVPQEYNQDYTMSDEDERIIVERIKERIETSPKDTWHYNKEKITKEQAINILYRRK
jgi:deoxyribonuclease (pyrimidine dimer)